MSLGKRPNQDQLAPSNQDESSSFDIIGLKITETESGVVKVVEVKDESSGFNNGIKKGDTIIKIGRENISSIEDYNIQIKKYSVGDVIMLRLERNESQVIRAFTIK